MMAWLRPQITRTVKGMTTEQLDWLLDAKANTIGARSTTSPPPTPSIMNIHSKVSNGKNSIKGNNVDFYLDLLKETRENTLTEFKKRDDKWFHVCEHESHHLGQIALLKSRVPGAKTGGSAN